MEACGIFMMDGALPVWSGSILVSYQAVPRSCSLGSSGVETSPAFLSFPISLGYLDFRSICVGGVFTSWEELKSYQ